MVIQSLCPISKVMSAETLAANEFASFAAASTTCPGLADSYFNALIFLLLDSQGTDMSACAPGGMQTQTQGSHCCYALAMARHCLLLA